MAVGGTVLNSDGGNPPNRLSETGWEYSGGGNSISEPAGPYQLGTAPTNCVTDENGNSPSPVSRPVRHAVPFPMLRRNPAMSSPATAY